MITLFNHGMSGLLGEGLFILCGQLLGAPLPDPTGPCFIVFVEGLGRANDKGPAKIQVPSLCDASHPSLFPSSPVWHPGVSENVHKLGARLERAKRKAERPFDWAFLLDPQILSSSFTLALCFPVLPSLSVSLHVMFLLAAWSSAITDVS